MTKALFFDIDGTLVSFKTHAIPASTIEALKRAKANGVKIYISTGRPFLFINNLGQIASLIDGYMTNNGAYCFIGKRDVCIHPIAKYDVQRIIDVCHEKQIGCVVVGKDKIAVIHPEKMKYIMQDMLHVPYENLMSPLSEVMQDDVLQVTPFFTLEQEAEVLPHLHSVASARWYPDFTDITASDANKGQGLVAMTEADGIAIADTIAFGDGGNDVTILRQAGIGVAMDNATDDVKANADYVTTSVDDDGIANALQHFGVI